MPTAAAPTSFGAFTVLAGPRISGLDNARSNRLAVFVGADLHDNKLTVLRIALKPVLHMLHRRDDAARGIAPNGNLRITSAGQSRVTARAFAIHATMMDDDHR